MKKGEEPKPHATVTLTLRIWEKGSGRTENQRNNRKSRIQLNRSQGKEWQSSKKGLRELEETEKKEEYWRYVGNITCNNNC